MNSRTTADLTSKEITFLSFINDCTPNCKMIIERIGKLGKEIHELRNEYPEDFDRALEAIIALWDN